MISKNGSQQVLATAKKSERKYLGIEFLQKEYATQIMF
jgi:hypothetical protein